MRNLADTWLSFAVAGSLIAVVATQAVLGATDGIWPGMLLDDAIRLAILVHLALVVQSDPPPHPESFWATQPRHPSAVAAAKLLHAGLILLILTGASLMTQSAWHFGVPAGREAIAAQWRYGTLALLTVVFVAAESRARPRAAVGAALFCYIVGKLAEDVSSAFMPGLTPLARSIDLLPEWSWIAVAAVFGVLFIRRYKLAEFSVRRELTTVALAILPLSLLIRGDNTPRPRVLDVSHAPPLTLALQTHGDFLSFELLAPRGLPGDAYRLVNWEMVATRRNGTTVRMNGSDDVLRRSDGRSAVVRLAGDSLDIIGSAFFNMHDSTGFQDIVGSFGPFMSNNVDDVASAWLEGTIESYRMDEIDRFPLHTGLAFLRDGRRAELTVLRGDTDGPAIWLQTKWLSGTTLQRAAWPHAWGMQSRDLSFALVNHARRSMLPLRVADSEGFSMGRSKMGFGVRQYDFMLRPAIWTLPRPPVDSAWLAGAEMVVGSPKLAGAVRIQVTGVVTPPVRFSRQRPFSR